jgi:hypothetical protein
VGKLHVLRGEIALAMGDGGSARDDLCRGLAIAREIGYPMLTWRAAHFLARAQMLVGEPGAAHESASLAATTITWIAERAPTPDLRRTFLNSPGVDAARELAARLASG